MKKLLLVALTLSTMQCFSQDIDQRLLVNKGESVKKTYQYNRNSYNYLLFELDSSYAVVTKSSLTKEERKLIKKNNLLTIADEALIGTDKFNLFSYGIVLSKTEKQYFALSNKQVLIVCSVPDLTKRFTTSSLNTK